MKTIKDIPLEKIYIGMKVSKISEASKISTYGKVVATGKQQLSDWLLPLPNPDAVAIKWDFDGTITTMPHECCTDIFFAE